jgi:hypothetical protein
MDPFRHAAISLAFLMVTIKDMISRALESLRAEDPARSPSPGRGASGAQDSERAESERARRPIDF